MSLAKMKKADLIKELERMEAMNRNLVALLDKDLTFRDLEAKMRDGTFDVRAVLGEGSQPVSRFLGALMMHWLLGEGDQDPVEPPNYLSGTFELTPANTFENITMYMEIVKPGGRTSHQIREELEAVLRRLVNKFDAMPDAGLTEDDPRLAWYTESYALRREAHAVLDRIAKVVDA